MHRFEPLRWEKNSRGRRDSPQILIDSVAGCKLLRIRKHWLWPDSFELRDSERNLDFVLDVVGNATFCVGRQKKEDDHTAFSSTQAIWAVLPTVRRKFVTVMATEAERRLGGGPCISRIGARKN